MRIVMFARVPRWYSFREDRLAKRIAAEGHEIAGIVVEKVKTRAALREWLFKLGPRMMIKKMVQKGLRLAGVKGAAPKTTAGARPIENYPPCHAPVYHVDSHNSPECVEIVRKLQPKVLMLRGCGIIKKQIIEIPEIGVINPHYALLPAYRGMDVTEWSALHGDPCAVSVHWVSEAVDVGAVLAYRHIEVERNDTLGRLREKAAVLAAELLSTALSKIEAGVAKPMTVPAVEGRQYFVMHPRLRQAAELRLRNLPS